MSFIFNKEKSIEINKKFALKYMKSDIGFYVQKKAIKLLIKALRVSNKATKTEVFKQIEMDFLNKKGFYSRRVFMEFVIELVDKFSIKFVENIGVLDNFFCFFNDKTSLNLIAIKLLKKIVPFASEKCVTNILNIVTKLSNELREGKELKNVND